jgi:excisionase family DNA binding protein
VHIDEDAVYTVAEVAQFVRVDHNTIRRVIRSGDLEALRIGSALRVEGTALVDYLTRCKQAAKTA